MTMKIHILNKINKQEFKQRLMKRQYENVDAVDLIERYFYKKRGYIFSMPQKGESVILLVSGGLDSTITWGILLAIYKLKVYPLFLHRGHKRWKREKKSLVFFTQYYQKKFPHLFVKPQEYSTDIPPKEITENMKDVASYLHYEKILKNLDLDSRVVTFNTLGILPYLFPHFGIAYGKYLEDHENVVVRTIFSSVCSGDGIVVPSQTFTALRCTMFDMCLATADFSWQFASLPFEKEIGHYLDKADLIKIGSKMGLPMEKTWSCYADNRYQCGKCLTCESRKGSFSMAGVTDKTSYHNERLHRELSKLKTDAGNILRKHTLTRVLLTLYLKYKGEGGRG